MTVPVRTTAASLDDVVLNGGKIPSALLPSSLGATPGIYVATDHGIVGDGATDNTSAINALLVLVNAAGGGVIDFGPGTFNHSGELLLTHMGGIWVRGTGYLTTTLSYTGTSTSATRVWFLGGSFDTEFSDFGYMVPVDFAGIVFDADWADPAVAGDVTRIFFRNVRFPTNAVFTPIPARAWIRFNHSIDCGISECTFNFGNNQVICSDIAYMINLSFRRCTFGDCNVLGGLADPNYDGYGVVLGAGYENVSFHDCTFEPSHAGDDGRAVGYIDRSGWGWGLTVVNCWLGDSYTSTTPWVKAKVLNAFFAGNKVITNTGGFLELHQSDGVTLVGNHIEGAVAVTFLEGNHSAFFEAGNHFAVTTPFVNRNTVQSGQFFSAGPYFEGGIGIFGGYPTPLTSDATFYVGLLNTGLPTASTAAGIAWNGTDPEIWVFPPGNRNGTNVVHFGYPASGGAPVEGLRVFGGYHTQNRHGRTTTTDLMLAATVTGNSSYFIDDVLFVDTSFGTPTITLPASSSVAGPRNASFTVRNSGATNPAVIAAHAGDTVEGSSTFSLAAGTSKTFFLFGGTTNWLWC